MKHGSWEEAEDAQLLEAAERLQMRWAAVAQELAPRTDSQCWRRYQVCSHYAVYILTNKS